MHEYWRIVYEPCAHRYRMVEMRKLTMSALTKLFANYRITNSDTMHNGSYQKDSMQENPRVAFK